MDDKPNATKLHREEQGLSFRAFADEVNKDLINGFVSYSKVRRWEMKNYAPDMNLLFECLVTYPHKWIAQWAVDNISELFPELISSGVVKFNLPQPRYE